MVTFTRLPKIDSVTSLRLWRRSAWLIAYITFIVRKAR
jgi:hypothetical protein